MFWLSVVNAQIQITLHIADHKHNLYKKTDLVVIGHFVDVTQNIAYLCRKGGNQQSSW